MNVPTTPVPTTPVRSVPLDRAHELIRLDRRAAGACAELEARLFPGDSPWPMAGFISELDQPQAIYLGINRTLDHKLMGYAGLAILGAPQSFTPTTGVYPTADDHHVLLSAAHGHAHTYGHAHAHFGTGTDTDTDTGTNGVTDGLAKAGDPTAAQAIADLQIESEVRTIGLDPAVQGKGWGRVLLEGILQWADAAVASVYLEVRTDNAPAIGLYQREGFVTLATRANYYQPSGADAYIMQRPPQVQQAARVLQAPKPQQAPRVQQAPDTQQAPRVQQAPQSQQAPQHHNEEE